MRIKTANEMAGACARLCVENAGHGACEKCIARYLTVYGNAKAREYRKWFEDQILMALRKDKDRMSEEFRATAAVLKQLTGIDVEKDARRALKDKP